MLPVQRFMVQMVVRAVVSFLGRFAPSGARTFQPDSSRPRQQYGYQQGGQQSEGGILQAAGNAFLWLGTVIILFFAAYFVAAALWHWRGSQMWNWIVALPQHPRVQAARQHLAQAPGAIYEEIQDIYLRLRFNWFTDQVAFQWQRFRHFIWDHLFLFAALSVALLLIWRITLREPEAKVIPLEEAGAHGWQVPHWAREQAERQKRGLNNYGSGGHANIPHIADSDVPWDEPAPVKKKSPSGGAVESDPRWDDFASSQHKEAVEPSTITIYEKAEAPSIITRWATVFKPREYEKGGGPIIITRWSTILQKPPEKTVYLTHTESEVETVHEPPTTITVYPEEDQAISTVTSYEEKTVTIASTEFVPKMVTKFVPTIIANVTPTTIYSIRRSTVTSLHTVTIPGTTLTSTVRDEPSTSTVTDTTVIQPVLESETGMPSFGHQDHDHVRRDVDGAVWCKTCRQYHCCQLPY